MRVDEKVQIAFLACLAFATPSATAKADVVAEDHAAPAADDAAKRVVATPPVAPAAAGDHSERDTRDGIYVRLGWVGGVFWDHDAGGPVVQGAHTPTSPSSYSTTSWGTGIELSIGGTPTDGLVVGGTLLYERSLTSDVSGGALPAATAVVFEFLGPFVEWCPRAAQGLHVGGALGLSDHYVTTDGYNTYYGIAALVDVGYDLRVSPGWSIGLTARAGAGLYPQSVPGTDTGAMGQLVLSVLRH